ncbi:MAG TPA: hypothetical protein PKV72_00805 [Candidatus Peribacteria bacterium]|nr:hypothetical protein [Candidatus Peribacteria bacterium]
MPTSKRKRTSGFLKSATALAALACLFVAAEWTTDRLEWLTPEHDESQMELMQAKYVAERGETAYDVLFLGDSTAGNDVIPKVFTQVTGLSAYSMHTNSNVSPVANVYLLDAYLRRHPAPKMVILVQTLYGWSIPQHHDVLLEHFMNPWLAWDLWRNGLLSANDTAEGMVSWWLPSLRHRRHIQRLRENSDLLAGLLGSGEGQFVDPELGHIPVTRNIALMGAYQGEIDGDRKLLSGAVLKPDAGLSAEALLMARRLCAIARDNGIQAAIVIPPLPAPAMSETGTLNGLTAMQARTVRETSDGCRMMSTLALPPELFGDGVHLNETGAELLTRKLGQFLIGMPQDPR